MTRHCPKCRSEFQDWVMTCLDCGTPTQEGPAPAGGDTYPAERSKRLEELNWQDEEEVVEDAEEERVEDAEDTEKEPAEVVEYSRLTPVDTSLRHCPRCGSEYQSWVEKCLDCGTRLKIGAAPASEPEARQEDIEDEIAAEEVDSAQAKSRVPINPNYKGRLIQVAVFKINPNVDIKELVSGIEADIKEDLLNEAGIRVYHNRAEYLSLNFLEFYVEEEQAEEAIKLLADYDKTVAEEKQNGSSSAPAADEEEATDSEKDTTSSAEPLKNEPVPAAGLEDSLKPRPGEPLAVKDSALPQKSISYPLPGFHSQDKKDEEDQVVRCPMCSSADLEVRTSFFSSKMNLKCRGCGSKWQA